MTWICKINHIWLSFFAIYNYKYICRIISWGEIDNHKIKTTYTWKNSTWNWWNTTCNVSKSYIVQNTSYTTCSISKLSMSLNVIVPTLMLSHFQSIQTVKVSKSYHTQNACDPAWKKNSLGENRFPDCCQTLARLFSIWQASGKKVGKRFSSRL